MHDTMNDLPARLRALPGFAPPQEGWTAVLAARVRRPVATGHRWPVALAAALAVGAFGLAWLASHDPAMAPRPDFIESRSPPAWDSLQAQNERLEQLLLELPERSAMRGRTALTVATLEDHLALVDERLTLTRLSPAAPEQAERLWRERVELMNSLVQVRYADVASIR